MNGKSQRKAKTDRWKCLEWTVVCLVAVALCVLSAGRELWYDEAFSVCMARCSFADMVSYTASDVHPPLYYLILKVFVTIFGQKLYVYRLVTALPFVLMLLAAGRFCRKYFGSHTSVFCVLFLTAAPSMLLYASEIRMYTWCQLFVILSMILAVELSQTRSWKKWLAFSLVNLLAAYTHYFAGAAVLLISIFLLISLLGQNVKEQGRTEQKQPVWYQRERGKRFLQWTMAMGLTGVLYLPWLFVFYQQVTRVKEDYWISAFDWEEIREYAQFVFGYQENPLSTFLGIVLRALVLAAAVMLIRYWKNQKKDWILAVNIGVFFGYIVLGVLLSVCVTPVFMRRYIIIVLPLFWLAVICALSQVKDKKVILILGCIGLIMFSISYGKEFRHRNSGANVTALSLLEEECTQGEVFYCTSPYVMAEMEVYFPQKACYIPKAALKGEAFTRWDEMSGCVITESAAEFCAAQHEVVWLLSYKDEEECVELFEENGYRITDKGKQTLGWGNGKKDSITIHVYRCELE